jgi:hypothetical protein
LDIGRKLTAIDASNASGRMICHSPLQKNGDGLIRQGDHAGAVAAYQESLDIARTLADKYPPNTQWQTHVVVSLGKLALAGDEPSGRPTEALSMLKQIKSDGRAGPSHLKMIDIIEGELAKLQQAEAQ